MKARYLILITTLLLSILLTVYAVWIATDNFDSYTPGASLESAAGGSSWNGNWNNSPDTSWIAQTAPAGGQGGVAAKKSGTSSWLTERNLTAISAGTVSWEMRISATPNADQFVGVILMSSTTQLMLIKMTNGGQIAIYDNGVGGYVNIQAFSVDTWYRIDVDFDDAAQNNLYRARVNGGTYTSYKTVLGGTYTTIDRLRLTDAHTTEHDFWIDDIRTVSTFPVTVFKHYYDLLRN